MTRSAPPAAWRASRDPQPCRSPLHPTAVTADFSTSSPVLPGSSGASWQSSVPAADRNLGAPTSGALLLELHHRLAAGPGHDAVDDGALGDRDAARDDVGLNHRRRADLELVLDHELAGDPAGDRGRERVNLPVPL